MSSSDPIYPVPAVFARSANLTPEAYASMYAASIADPESFWGTMGQRLDWIKPYSQVKNVSWDEADLSVKWYEDGVLNVSANCLDRHLPARGDKRRLFGREMTRLRAKL